MPDSEEAKRLRREGFEAGAQAAEMAQFREHFESINGSVERTAKALIEVRDAVRILADEVRRDKEAVVVRADTLAAETENRRNALAETAASADRLVAAGDRSFSRRERLVGAAGGLVLVALAVLTATGWP
jgi:methyl-accepting chemotaxis protein